MEVIFFFGLFRGKMIVEPVCYSNSFWVIIWLRSDKVRSGLCHHLTER